MLQKEKKKTEMKRATVMKPLSQLSLSCGGIIGRNFCKPIKNIVDKSIEFKIK